MWIRNWINASLVVVVLANPGLTNSFVDVDNAERGPQIRILLRIAIGEDIDRSVDKNDGTRLMKTSLVIRHRSRKRSSRSKCTEPVHVRGPRAPHQNHSPCRFSSLKHNNNKNSSKETRSSCMEQRDKAVVLRSDSRHVEAWVSVRNTKWAKRWNYCWWFKVTQNQLPWSGCKFFFVAVANQQVCRRGNYLLAEWN